MSGVSAQSLGARLLGKLRAPATGAVVAQVWQAMGTFVIQILAARILGAEGLGSMALCLGVIIMTAAITSGMIGDSLTVLDRHDRSVRAGLQAWTLILAVVGSAGCAAVLYASGVLEVWGAVAFAAAAALFQLEEVLRRVLMASMRFWALVIVDSTSVLGTLGLLAVLSRSGLTLATFLAAIAGGQLLGALVAALLLSPQERRLVSLRGAALGKVASFGAWRGAQVGVTPTALTVSRTAVIAVAGVVALGQLEAARIIVAPLLLVVQGLGSYLLASYARDKSAPLSRLMDRAARASAIMAVGAIGLGCVAAALTPFLAPRLTGPDVHVSWVAVLGWAVYSAASATLQPFASLAAARGRQRAVLLLRIADSVIGLTCLVLLLRVLGVAVSWTPYVLALSLFTSGVVVRFAVLRPMSRKTDQDTHGGPDGPHPGAGTDRVLVAAGSVRPEAESTPDRVFTRLRWMSTGTRRWVRSIAAGAVISLAAAGLTAAPASADPLPTPLPSPVGASALPTWQINGVAWSQAIVGNTVYVVGSFTKARPPGVAVGGAGEIPASNIFAYDLTTGNRVASFDHNLNGQGLVVQASPDGSRVYVGGDFTTVDGQARGHLAAFNTSDGSLVADWTPNTDGQVRALSISSDTVYVGGNFRSANGQARTSLAAFNTANRTMTAWAPTAEGTGGYVWAMTLSPDLSRVIVGGSFSTLSGQNAYGMGALDASTGAVLPWAANQTIRTAGLNGGITSLKTDGEQIFGSGYAFGSGATFEGTFAADPGTGAINWVNDCLGDTYDVFPMNKTLYWVAHSHDCSVVGGYPDTNPRARWQKAAASPTFPTGMTTVKDAYGWDFRNIPYAGLLQWYPDLEFGTYTPDRQAAWSVTGSGDYVTLAGEFPIVNGTPQQGLVRFANRSAATPSQKPAYSAGMTPVATSNEAGVVRLTWTSTWDRDDNNLTYDVYRDGGPSIGSVSGPSTFWQLPALGFRDTGRTPGATHTYKIRVKDSDGNVQWSVASAPVTVSSAQPTAYTQAVRADGATHHWKLNDSGPTFLDSSGFADGTAASSTFGASGALTGDSAVSSSGGSNPKLYSRTSEAHPTAATVEAWVKTTSSQGGRVVGFGNSMNGTSAAATNDLVLYLTSNGRASFGVNNGAWRAVTSTRTVNDGQWHHLAATADSSGLSLFVDGRRVARDQSPVTMASFPGYWRLLADQTSGLPSAPGSQALNGAIDEVAVYPTALDQTKVKSHYLTSGRSANWATPGTDAYAQSVVATDPDQYWRLGESSGSTAVDGSGSGRDGTITGGVTFNRSGAIGGTTNTAAQFNGSNGLTVAKESWTAPSSYSTELWFSSTSRNGGKLIGFGNATSGLSASYDRQVVLLSNGRLQFSTYPGVQAFAETTTAYNDGQWHHVVATQGTDGMKLYVDSVLRASNPATTSSAYVGYWRIGGDRTWGGTSSNYVNATIDEVAVYPTVLGQADVDSHYAASGRQLPNKAPTSAFTVSKNHLAVAVDGSTSTDPDGTIASYAWNFGDGSTATTATATRTYAAAGTYTVSLTVTDNSGATNTKTQSVTVAPNAVPVAAFTSSATQLAASFDAAGSSDPDGTLASYAWNFGDGTTGTGVSPSHTYPDDGTYQVALTVTDNSGATAQVTHPITVARPANVLPTAVMTHTEAFLKTSLDATGSSDPDGTIAAYAWAFGDGTTGTGATTSHTYAADGTYDVVLTVTDDRGGSRSVTQSVTVAANQKPVARFTSTATFLDLAVDGSGSTDADGTIAGYAWNFGDGTTGTGATASRTYAAAGTYTVVLTITDNAGATSTVEHDVTVAANPVLATDEFGRTAANGWGTAELGGAWTVAGTASRYSVADGVGKVVLAVGASGTTTLGGVATSTAESALTISTDKAPTGGGQYVSVIGRKVSATSDYRAKVRLGADGVVSVWLARTVNGTETLMSTANVAGVTYAAGDKLRTRLQVSGTSPTQVRVKVWKDGTTEPASWLLTTTDSTAELQTTGSVAIYSYVSGSTTNAPVTFAYDSLWVGGLRP